LAQVHVLEAEILRLANAEPAPVEQVNNQPGRITVNVAYTGKKLAYFRLGWTLRDSYGLLGPEGYFPEILLENFSIEEQQGIEGFELRQTPLTRQGWLGTPRFSSPRRKSVASDSSKMRRNGSASGRRLCRCEWRSGGA
jgi:hypothetical protein